MNGAGTFLAFGSIMTFEVFGSIKNLLALESILANDADLGIGCLAKLRAGFIDMPEVDGSDMDDIDGFDAVEIFLCSKTFVGSL